MAESFQQDRKRLDYNRTIRWRRFGMVAKSEIEKLAEELHEKYNVYSEIVGWKVKKECQVPFIELPEDNKRVMKAMAKYILERFERKKDA